MSKSDNYDSANFEDITAERERLDAQMRAVLDEELAAYRSLGLPASGRLLDVGSGSGAPARMLQALGFDVTCVDSDAAALSQLPRKLTARVNASAEQLPFEADSFDVVYSRLVMQHVRDPEQAALEMLRVSRPGGLILVIDTDQDTWTTHPPIEAVERARATFRRDARARGCDPCIGRRLLSLFASATKSDVRVLCPSTGTVPAPALSKILFEPFLRYVGEDPAERPELQAWLETPGAFASANVVVLAATP